MPLTDYVHKSFIKADTSVAAGVTEVEGTDFDSEIMELAHIQKMSISCYVKGADAGAAGNVEFCFAAYDQLRGMWDTIYYIKVTVALDGANEVQKTISAIPSPEKLKLLSITNPDDAAIDANASCVMKR